MSRETIHAYTAPGSHYPAYVNASREGDMIVLTVRSPADGVRSGDTAAIKLTESEALHLGQALLGEECERVYKLVRERHELIKAVGVEGRAESVEANDALLLIKTWRAAIEALYKAIRA